MLEYRGALALAPMVRVSELPVRLLSLRYGADLVWSPEIVDKKIIGTKRVWNPTLDCVDFVAEKDGKLAFRTCPAQEKPYLIFQLGTADPELAVEAALKVAQDVSGIDVNCGCPKHFSIHSGMGAALLKNPDRLEAILRALVERVGRPHGLGISAKIRIMDTAEKTYELVRRLVKTGISCLTVHARTAPMRPREPAQYDYIQKVSEICREAGVACLLNGDVANRDHSQAFVAKYDVDGCMIARGAEENPSCFRTGPLAPVRDIAREFVALCGKYDFPAAHAKYCLTSMIPGKDPLYQKVIRAKALDAFRSALDSEDSPDKPAWSPPAKKLRVA